MAVPTYWTKLTSFLLAAVPCGIGGAFYVYSQQFISPGSVSPTLSIYILAGMVIGLAQCLLLAVLMFTLFGLQFAGDPTPLLAGSALFVFCVVAFGSLVGAAIPNQAAAVQAVALGGFLLAFLLSGLIFPIENMPRVFQLGMQGTLAQQHVIVKFGAVVVKGAGYAHYKVLVDR